MSDYLIKALAFDGQIRAYAMSGSEMVGEAQRRHQTWPTASAALGRSMMASTMMASMLKSDKHKMTVKIEGGGPIGAIVVDAAPSGHTRGYVTNPQVHFDLNQHGKLDVARAVGKNGFLSVVKDLGLRDNFTGQVPLVSGEIGDDFTYYFAASEQVPSSVGVGVLVNPDNSILAAGGFVIQVLPNASDTIIDLLEERISAIPPISKLVEKGLTPEEILFELLGKENVKILDKMPVSFQCTCSRDRIANALVSLGREEIRSIIEDEGQAEAHCHFCNETYLFAEDELEELYNESR
ncbi:MULTISPECIES: Hsp33 family molecular chaperone HslO [unclassified Fictibacillus]|uniref:Hsp33 family molecular chaperone HslO n=1 Tax=unclassified Fictibacillus TaxID=2644029 RepID=UPI0006A7D98E|nr:MULTISPECIES: Hsp33 family molecular chaperone HslO [unclassified Fictibacillus]MED2971573.1 Hsp33 family molecular chaperone HslO [Fictibacillus sp. B-59209]UZJ78932.1 Hsp33 family molecular chaperone HslO [Fictibacillus sp. KU28468]SFF14654.1 molecular chaperone Hsp33 [Bacillus sp. OV194]